ncbi:methyl-accepting chemotaxis protein [Reinekea forsetii]|nr:methyl-accepting chemotaxis protein [Reinekea forsetii]
MLQSLNMKHWSVRWRTQFMVLFQVGLTLLGFAALLSGLSYISDLMDKQKTIVDQQQVTLSEQNQRFQEQRVELTNQQNAIKTQQAALDLQSAVLQVYQVYPKFLFWRLASTSSLSNDDIKNGDAAEKELIEAVKVIQEVDEELGESIDLFLLDLSDFNDSVTRAIEAFRNEENRYGRSIVSASQNQVITMTSVLEVSIYIANEVVEEAQAVVNESLGALETSVAAVEQSGRDIADSVNQVVQSNRDTVAEVQSRESQVMIILLVITVLSILVGVLLSRSIINPLNQLRGKIEAISQHADLTIVMDESRRDDIGIISHSINSMLESFRDMVDSVRTSASSIASETDTQTHNNQEVRDALANLNVEVDSVATAINEMTASVSGINSITSSAASAASEGNALCESSEQQVQHSSEQVMALNDQLTQASRRLSELATKTEQIYSVVDAIQGISEQTNLLALNAAIEAARAGEQGRGFAVVADEVRTLAQRTDQSTAEIKVMVEEFTKEVQTTVEAVNNASSSAEAARSFSDSARSSIDSLHHSMVDIQQMNEQISQSTQEQTDATSAIDASVSKISMLLVDIADKANLTAEAMVRLNQSTLALEDQSQQFKS